MRRARTRLPARQRGIALLVLLALFSIAVIYALVTGLNKSASALAVERQQKTAAALAQAKQALIAYAVTYKDTHDDPMAGPPFYTVPGYLPCPDFGAGVEGVAAGSGGCGSSLVSAIGRLPWSTLGLSALRDGSGECLWYAVSGTYKNTPNGVSGSTTTSNMMNWDTNGQFDILAADGVTYLAGATSDANAVAVIFAPGSALAPSGTSSVQDRTPPGGPTECGGNYNAAAYLETANGINNSTVSGTASANTTFIAGSKSDTFNDQLVYITRADIWNAIKKRSDFNNYLRAMTRRAAECVAMYGVNNSGGGTLSDQRLPWGGSLSQTSIPRYAVDDRYRDISGTMAGRLAYRVANSRGSTNNTLPPTFNTTLGSWQYYLLNNNSYCSYTADQQIWYDNWKDQLFYAVANSYSPWAGSSPSCGTCLHVNGSGNYAAVVIFAGDKLTNSSGQVTQPRSLVTDKSQIGNYLEGRNASSYPNSGGNSNYQVGPASSTFNDIIYAIYSISSTQLGIMCSNAGGNMVSVPAAAVAPNVGLPSPPDLSAYAACP